MPDLDSGHIFLTTFAPIKNSNTNEESRLSFEQNVRVSLAKLPSALQSPATLETGLNSPFSRNKRNHLTRMFVLDNAVYNGRTNQSALAGLLPGGKKAGRQKVDALNAPYLVFCAEIDAITKDGDPLPTTLTNEEQRAVRAAYAIELWQTMELELQDIYSNCYGFENVDTAEQFAEYLEECHVETTMPFHDYYLELPAFHVLPYKPLLAAVALPAIVAILALLGRLFDILTLPYLGWSTFWTFIVALVLTAVIVVLAIKYAISNGEKSLAPARYGDETIDDLQSVLKSLYIQQNFADFAIKHQGSSADKLHKDFGAFLKKHRPSDRSGPSQNPGEISVKPAKPTKSELIS